MVCRADGSQDYNDHGGGDGHRPLATKEATVKEGRRVQEDGEAPAMKPMARVHRRSCNDLVTATISGGVFRRCGSNSQFKTGTALCFPTDARFAPPFKFCRDGGRHSSSTRRSVSGGEREEGAHFGRNGGHAPEGVSGSSLDNERRGICFHGPLCVLRQTELEYERAVIVKRIALTVTDTYLMSRAFSGDKKSWAAQTYPQER